MNAPHTTAPLTMLALKLVSGEPCPLYEEQSLYSDAEWKEAADFALADGDYDELSFMVARQRCFDEFHRDPMGFEDFGNWLANKARWNQPNKYQAAMTWRERANTPDLSPLCVERRVLK